MKRCKHQSETLAYLNGKKVCTTCDELLIDIEIECEEEESQELKSRQALRELNELN